MRILLIVDDYLPYSIKVGAKMMHELAVELVARKHVVTVVTPDANLEHSCLITKIDEVNVCYFASGQLKNVPYVRRAINELLMPYRAWHYLKIYFKKHPQDYIVYYSPSIFWASLVQKLKKCFNVPSFLILRDLFPQWVIDQGIIKKWSPLAIYFKIFEKLNYRSADTIALQSPKNLVWFNGVHNRRSNKSTIVMYNWAKNKPVHSNGAFRRKYNLEDRILFFYGGNLGHAQDIGNLLRLAEKFKDKKDITFIFLGAGDEAVLVTEKMKELDNILYIEPVSQEQFKLILSDVDIGLFSLSRSHETHNFPGKLLGYMVQDIPILGSVNPGNDIIETVNKHKAGLVSVNGDDELLYKNANKLYEDSHLRKSMGLNARYLLNSLFSVESAVDIILENYIR